MVTTPEEEEERPAPAEPTRPESPAQPLSPPYSAAEDQELDEDQQELQRLREELAALHQQFESPGRRQRQITVLRQVVAAVLVLVAALGVTMSVVVWAGNTILNTACGPDFARANLDPLRICGVVAAGILLLFTSWAGLFWILVLLGVYELLMTAVAAAGHGPAGGEASSQAPDAGRTSRSSGLIA